MALQQIDNIYRLRKF